MPQISPHEMVTVKPLESRTVHQIQSGQVIIDLCSVVKELVENSLDAGATSIEVRFKNNGVDSIEVQDNGVGIASDNYESIALKHHTSKLSSYDDLSSLQTFGFRGEALSSLCALAKFYITTARADEAPKGMRLDFDISGTLQSTRVVASQKGTTVTVENIFWNLPVRRRELEKNIKREYGKALGVLQTYACISTQARISVSNMMTKGKRNVVFATRSCPTTKENIAIIFGAKVLPGLVTMDLNFEMRPTITFSQLSDPQNKQVRVVGHVSKPTLGEGRQTPDRQMFFVNGRPCALPQVAKVFNEVYRSYNVSQSPFVFSNIILDTNGYDVNVSPDKRTILLHEQGGLLDSLRVSLTELLEKENRSVPVSQRAVQKLPFFKQLTVNQEAPNIEEPVVYSMITKPHLSEKSSVDTKVDADRSTARDTAGDEPSEGHNAVSLIENFAGRDSKERARRPEVMVIPDVRAKTLSKDKQKLVKKLGKDSCKTNQLDENDDTGGFSGAVAMGRGHLMAVNDFNGRIAEQQSAAVASPGLSSYSEPENLSSDEEQLADSPSSTPIRNAFNSMRPRRNVPDVATITIGTQTRTSVLGSSSPTRNKTSGKLPTPVTARNRANYAARDKFTSGIQSFAAPESELIKTVGKPRSKSCLLVDLLGSRRGSRVFTEDLSTGSGASDHRDGIQLSNENSLNAEELQSTDGQSPSSWGAESDGEYPEEQENKARGDAKVAELIRKAEEASAVPSQDNRKRAHQILKGAGLRDSTAHLVQVIDASVERIDTQLITLSNAVRPRHGASGRPISETSTATSESSPEERLSLTISKTDFADMHIPGQFNLGFILATRDNADLFIIDQHASDEKYNFERLQSNTIVQNQRLVQPRTLHLTAIEEEVVVERNEALLKNGFLVEVDTTGGLPVGQRCKLISLPMSREVTFDITDLEELISLLADSSASASIANIPRPTKVRRMFAMRACRSSIMVGKTLTLRQMSSLVGKMGQIDKPWNCPHGRPTMRHVCGLDGLEEWREGDGLIGMEEDGRIVDWGSWYTRMTEGKAERDEEDQDEEDQDEEDQDEEDQDEEDQDEEDEDNEVQIAEDLEANEEGEAHKG